MTAFTNVTRICSLETKHAKSLWKLAFEFPKAICFNVFQNKYLYKYFGKLEWKLQQTSPLRGRVRVLNPRIHPRQFPGEATYRIGKKCVAANNRFFQESRMMKTKKNIALRFIRADQLKPMPPVTKLFRDTREVAILDEYGRDGYRIGLDRINTSGKLLNWILHLSVKNWITTRHIHELIEIAQRENGIEVNYGA